MPLHQHVRALLVYVDFIHCRSDILTTDGCFCRITSQTVFFLQLLSSVSVETEKQPQIQQWCSCTDATLAPVGSHDILFFQFCQRATGADMKRSHWKFALPDHEIKSVEKRWSLPLMVQQQENQEQPADRSAWLWWTRRVSAALTCSCMFEEELCWASETPRHTSINPA